MRFNPFPEILPPRRGTYQINVVGKITLQEFVRVDQWDGKKWVGTLDNVVCGWRENVDTHA